MKEKTNPSQINWTKDIDDLTSLPPSANLYKRPERPEVTKEEFEELKKKLVLVEKQLINLQLKSNTTLVRQLRNKLNQIEGDNYGSSSGQKVNPK
jgi:hypothetical protein